MRIFVLGGSGRTGQLVIEECLSRGHQVTALVRVSKSLEEKQDLKIVEGSPLNKADIERAFMATNDKPSAAIVTLASLRATNSPFATPTSPARLMADSNANLAAIMQQFGIKKIVIMQAAGVGASWSMLPLITKGLMGLSNMKYAYKDHDQVDEEIRKTGLDFILVRPPLLTDEEARPIRHLAEQGKGLGLMSSISRKSVAKFLLDAVEKDDWNKTSPVITN